VGNTEKKLPSVIILVVVISLAPMNVVLCAPGLPQIAEYFNITNSQSQQLIAVFLLGYAISQLIFGPLANTYGRRKSLFSGLCIGVIGCILCVLSGFIHQFSLLLVGRFITGFGTAAGLVLSFTIINDVFTGIKARQVTGLCVMSFAVVPGVANIIGGFLTQYFGWESCFYFLVVYDVVVAILVLGLTETLERSMKKPLQLSVIAIGYLNALKNLTVIMSGIIYGLSVSCLYGIIALLPFIGVYTLKMSPSMFGTVFLTSYVGYLIGSIVTTATAGKLKTTTSILIGIVISLIGGGVLALMNLFNCISVFTVFSAIFIVFAGCPFVFINSSIYGISSHNDKANASSILNFIYVFLAFCTVYFTGKIHDKYLLTLSMGIVFLMIISLLIYFTIVMIKEKKRI
jgi:MFS family permease